MHNKIKDSTILVTGGAGFIGSYVIEELLPLQPKKIIIIDNLIRGGLANMKKFLHNPTVEFHKGDIRDLDLLEHCIEGTDYIFIWQRYASIPALPIPEKVLMSCSKQLLSSLYCA